MLATWCVRKLRGDKRGDARPSPSIARRVVPWVSSFYCTFTVGCEPCVRGSPRSSLTLHVYPCWLYRFVHTYMYPVQFCSVHTERYITGMPVCALVPRVCPGSPQCLFTQSQNADVSFFSFLTHPTPLLTALVVLSAPRRPTFAASCQRWICLSISS